jgi:hypothetical protein
MGDLNGHRHGNGRFAAGNPGGPGRPRRAAEQDYLIAVSEAISPERFRKIAERAADAAEKGDAKARQWVTDVLLGRRATTSMALTATEEVQELNFRALTDEELWQYSDLYERMCEGHELPADEAQVYVRLTVKTLASAEKTGGMFDGEGDD